MEKGTTLVFSEVNIVEEAALKKLVFDAVFQLLPQGPVSLKGLREILQQRTGVNLASDPTLCKTSTEAKDKTLNPI